MRQSKSQWPNSSAQKEHVPFGPKTDAGIVVLSLYTNGGGDINNFSNLALTVTNCKAHIVSAHLACSLWKN